LYFYLKSGGARRKGNLYWAIGVVGTSNKGSITERREITEREQSWMGKNLVSY